MDGQKAIREEEKLLKKVDAMKKKRLLLWLVLPAVLWFSACNTEINTDDKTGSTMSVNLRAKSGDDVKARLIFWRESDYHGLDSVPAIPYCVCLPGNPINSYQSSTNLPYNTGVPYPNTYEKLHVTGYSPQELLPENGSGQDVLSGDYRTVPLTDKYKGGKSDILSCSGTYTGSEEQPFDGQQTHLLFEHASTRIIFKLERDKGTEGLLMFRNARIELPDTYAPQSLQWQGDNYHLVGCNSDYDYFGEERLRTRTETNSILIDETLVLDTLYIATHKTVQESHPGIFYLKLIADRSDGNFEEGSYIEEEVEWIIPIDIKEGGNGQTIENLKAGHSYEITITFMLNSFRLEAAEEEWEDHVVVDVQIINEE